MTERNFLQRTGDSIKDAFVYLRDDAWDDLGSEGNHPLMALTNLAVAASGGYLAFRFAQSGVGGILGGGMVSQIAAVPISIMAAIGGAVFLTKGFNVVVDWGRDTLSGEPEPTPASSSEPARQPARAQQPEPDTPEIGQLAPPRSVRPEPRPNAAFVGM